MPVIFDTENNCDTDFNKMPLICSDIHHTSFIVESDNIVEMRAGADQ